MKKESNNEQKSKKELCSLYIKSISVGKISAISKRVKIISSKQSSESK